MKRSLKALFAIVLCLICLLGACVQGGSEGKSYLLPDIKEPYVPPPVGDAPPNTPAPEETPPARPRTITISKIIFTPVQVNAGLVTDGGSAFRFDNGSRTIHILKLEIAIGVCPGGALFGVFESDLPLALSAGQAHEFPLAGPLTFDISGEDFSLYIGVGLEVRCFDVVGIPKGTAYNKKEDMELTIEEGGSIKIFTISLDEDLSSLSSCGVIFDLELVYEQENN